MSGRGGRRGVGQGGARWVVRLGWGSRAAARDTWGRGGLLPAHGSAANGLHRLSQGGQLIGQHAWPGDCPLAPCLNECGPGRP